MGPRKKSKPNPEVEAAGKASDQATPASPTPQAPVQVNKQDRREGVGENSNTDDQRVSEAGDKTTVSPGLRHQELD